MKCSVSKDKQAHHTMNDVGLPAYLYSSLELETMFTQDGIDPMEFPFDQLEFLHVLGLYVELTVSVDVRHCMIRCSSDVSMLLWCPFNVDSLGECSIRYLCL